MNIREVRVGQVKIGGDHNPLVFIAGPCVIERTDVTLRIAERLRKYAEDIGINIIFKTSYDKANRTSVKSFRGPGIDEGLKVLERIKCATGLPVISDVHTTVEVLRAADVLDMLQIPALLSRQTDLLIAAGMTGLPVNIKKGQFMAPWDAKYAIDKVFSTGNENVTVTERGSSFGYNNLVVDMRSIPIMRKFGLPVIYDATHGIQLPGGKGEVSGGEKEFIEPLARAAVAAGCDALFTEVHESPESALCDGPNMLHLNRFPDLAVQLTRLRDVIRS